MPTQLPVPRACSGVRPGRTRAPGSVRDVWYGTRSSPHPAGRGLVHKPDRTGGQARRSRASAVSRRSRSSTPSGPLTTTSESSTSALSSSRGGADQQRGQARARPARRPPRTPRGRRGRRRRRANAAGVELLDEPRRTASALVHARGADLDHVAAGLDDQVVALGQLARAPAAAGRRPRRRPAADGCARRRRGPSPRRRRPRRPAGAAAAGSSRRNAASPCGGRGRDDPAVGGGPALVAVLAEDVAAPCRRRRSRRPTSSSPPRSSDLPGRAAGDHRDRAHLRGQVDQHARRRRGGCARRRGRRRSATGCRRSPGRRRRRRRPRTSAAYRCSPSAEVNSMAPPNHDAAPRARGPARSGGSRPVRITVSRSQPHRVDRGRDAGWMPRSRASSLAGGLEPRPGSRPCEAGMVPYQLSEPTTCQPAPGAPGRRRWPASPVMPELL